MKQIYIFFVAIFSIQTAQSQIINIPDANFKDRLINIGIDTNSDNEIQVSEAENVTYLNIYNQNISSLVGIEYFINLETIFASNNNLTTLDLSSNLALLKLTINNNQITNLGLSQNTNLSELSCDNNLLTNIDISQNINLQKLHFRNNQISNITLIESITDLACDNNPLTSIDLSQVPNLTRFYSSFNPSLAFDLTHAPNLLFLTVSDNEYTSLDLSLVPNLTFLNCNNNELASLDLSNLSNLSTLYCNNNLLTSLDASSNYINYLSCVNNQITYINLRDGLSGNYYSYFEDLIDYYIVNNPIEYICVDDFGYESAYLNSYGYNTGTYCSFVPGGDYYTFEGNTKVDLNTNGCDASDSFYPNLKFNIIYGTNTSGSSFISNASGDYSFPVNAGIHTITPELEFPDYFTVSPTSVAADFPTDTSPFIQDFCITPNGTHNDLEITMIPLNVARPGFDSNYKLVYKNKGNTTMSGSIDFTFNDDVMDLVSTNPITDSQSTGSLSWNFTNLEPFESGEIILTMNLNAPTETPPLNNGDVLGFVATINPVTGDETIEDNTFELNQTVVNSYDPNDKTCLEGNTVEPDMIGKNVHYLVRFENTGTAHAINVVVKDIIDTAKFDVSTLFLTDASHSVVTRITNTNVVEFIFENINLPFDDVNNDGYISFKIKTLPTLVEGDTFANDAEIYFDYNFPIDTNNALTTIESSLNTSEFELSELEIYPNPLQDKLYINGIDSIQSVTIYDLSGRLINQVSYIGNHSNLEISTEKLSQGTYFVKVITDVGEFVKKVVKE